MLSPADRALIASMDVPSLRQTAEEVAAPRCEAAAAVREAFDKVPSANTGTRVALGHIAAKAEDLSAIVRLLRALETDPAGTLAALGKALIADDASGRPRAAVIPLRVIEGAPKPTAAPSILRRAVLALVGRSSAGAAHRSEDAA